MIMNSKVDIYRKCHIALAELYDNRQIPLSALENEVKTRLTQDRAIRHNGFYGAITPKGDDLFLKNKYLELAEDAENKEKEKEMRVRDSLMNQLSVEKADEQNIINRQMLLYQKVTIVFSGIAAIGTIIGLLKGCY